MRGSKGFVGKKWKRSKRMFDYVWPVCSNWIGLRLPSRLKLNQTSTNKTWFWIK